MKKKEKKPTRKKASSAQETPLGWAKERATGVVFEWENAFPYPGMEPALRPDAYTPEEVTNILDCCRSNGLKAVPLMQTLGHLQWCLAQPAFRELREFDETDAQIRACDSRSWDLLQNCLVYINTLMIQQVLKVPEYLNCMTTEDFRGLTPLMFQHINPYGTFSLDMNLRLPIEQEVA